MFERISRSFSLARSSWNVLTTDKQLVLFPVISGITFLAVLISFAVPLGVIYSVNEQAFESDHAWMWLLPVGFAFYFCTAFVMVFCNAALISCALMRFNGETPTLGDGFRAAWARLPQIFAWSLVSATVSVLLNLVENAHEKAGYWIRQILGTLWSVVTYFVVPVLVVEKVGPFAAIKRSTQILRKTWGEALAGGFGLGLFKILLLLPILLLVLPAVLCFTTGLWPVGIAFVVLAFLYFMLWLAVTSALDTIFLGALYQYAAFDQVPSGFEADTMANAFKPARG